MSLARGLAISGLGSRGLPGVWRVWLGWRGTPAFHDLRHSAATMAIASGANVKVVQQMLGHSSASAPWTPTPTYGRPCRNSSWRGSMPPTWSLSRPPRGLGASRGSLRSRAREPKRRLTCEDVQQGGRDSNPRPLVLETRALPTELPPYEAQSSPALRAPSARRRAGRSAWSGGDESAAQQECSCDPRGRDGNATDVAATMPGDMCPHGVQAPLARRDRCERVHQSGRRFHRHGLK